MGFQHVEEFLDVAQLEGRLCVHRPKCLSHFQQSSALSQMVIAIPCSGASHIYDAALIVGHPCHGGRSALQRGLLCTAHDGYVSSQWSFLTLGFFNILARILDDQIHLRT